MPIFNPTSLIGTANQILVNGTVGVSEFGQLTLTLPQSIGTASSPTFTGLTLTGLTPNSFIYSGPGDVLASTAPATNGQLLIGSTGLSPVLATLTAGTGISVTNGAGSITISNVAATPGGGYLGRNYSVSIGSLSGTTQMPSATAPTIANGYQIATITLTPTTAQSRFILNCSAFVDLSANNNSVQMAVFRGNTLVATSSVVITTSGRPQTLAILVEDSPATTASITYSVRVGMDTAGTSYVNQYNNGTNMGGTARSAFAIYEIS